MRELPIIFSTDMVKAILDGRKTVTRRVIKPQPVFDGKYWSWKKSEKDWFSGVTYEQLISDKGLLYPERTPYQKGDLLWVRETWWDLGHMENGKWQGRIESHTIKPRYVASCPDPFSEGIGGIIQPVNIPWRQTSFLNSTWRKRPSIHMPKWAARIWLEVLDVRVERLQEITEKDAIKEGMYQEGFEIEISKYVDNPVEQFAQLWDSLNAKRGYGWDVNPWVLRYEFNVKQGSDEKAEDI